MYEQSTCVNVKLIRVYAGLQHTKTTHEIIKYSLISLSYIFNYPQ